MQKVNFSTNMSCLSAASYYRFFMCTVVGVLFIHVMYLT